jgi:hypothetical protein
MDDKCKGCKYNLGSCQYLDSYGCALDVEGG